MGAYANGPNGPNSGYSPNNDSLPFGSMQGMGGMDGFDSGSPIDQNLANLLNIDPLQQQVDQMTGGATTDPSSPLSYVNNTLSPIIGGAEQTYKQAMAASQTSQKKN